MVVTSQLSSFEDFEGTPTLVGYGGGAGASVNDDVIIEGTQSAGRRVDNTTDKGFGASVTAVDLSGAGEHIKVWLFVTQWSEVTQVQVRISSGADDDHELPISEYPPLGGFIPVWIDVSRTPEVGGSANEASIGEIGVLLDIGDVGGNASNLILDEIQYGTSGLLWDGSTGSFSNFQTFESTNNEGNVVTISGVLFVYSRLEIGSSTATTFIDSGFTLIFPDQELVASTFMGITIDLQNASTDIDFSNGAIQSSNVSGATKRPDFLVTGASGAFNTSSVNIIGMRTIDLTSGCTVDGGVLDTLNLTQDGAEIKNATINARATTNVAMCNDTTFGVTSGIHDCNIVQADAGHAFEITSVGSITLTNLTFSGFGGTVGSNLTSNSGASDAVFYNNSGGLVTLNVSGGDSPSVRNGSGATTVVNNTVSVKVTTRDSDGNLIENAHVFLEGDTGGALPVEDSVTITRATTIATVSHTAHGLETGMKVAIRGAIQTEYNGVHTITVTTANAYTYTVSGSPTTPATGTITGTGVALNSLTNVSGIAENTGFNFGSNQPIIGYVRKSSSSPFYKETPISGTITSNGFDTTIALRLDE